MSIQRSTWSWIIGLLFLVLGSAGAWAVSRGKKKPAQAEQAVIAVSAVSVVQIKRGPVTVEAQVLGEVIPAQQLNVIAELGGRILRLNPELVSGGRVKKGEWLVEIDQKEYQIGLQQELSRLSSAESELTLEKGRHSVATREWELIGLAEEQGVSDSEREEAKRLALREPQQRSSAATVDNAKNAVERARLTLSKTRISAPWDAAVTQVNVSVGQVVAPGSQLARLVGSKELWIEARLSEGQAAQLRPNLMKAGACLDRESCVDPAVVMVRYDYAEGESFSRQARLIRMEAEIERSTGTVGVIASLMESLDGAEALPLMPGASAKLVIKLRSYDDAALIPQQALRNNNSIFEVKDGVLIRREVKVLGFVGEQIAVQSELRDGVQVLLQGPGDEFSGMNVRVVNSKTKLENQGSKP